VQFLFASGSEWLLTLLLSCFITLLAFPFYRGVSLWFGVAAFVATATLMNIALSSRFCLPLPQLAFFVAVLQALLGPWLAYYFPSDPRFAYNIGAFLPAYLAYAGPACLSFGLGLLLPVAWVSLGRLHSFQVPSHLDIPHLQRELTALFWVGVIASVGASYAPGNLAFVAVLLRDLMLVATLMELLAGLQSWRIHALISFSLLVAAALTGGVFHKLILWFTIMALMFVLRNKWKWRAVLVVLVGFIAVLILQQIKVYYRVSVAKTSEAALGAQLSTFGSSAGGLLGNPEAMLDKSALAATAVRLNQGWIVTLAMKHVPAVEPFCHGEILKSQLIGLVIPRFIMPDKFMVANNAEFTRFTGKQLTAATTMTLGYLGEMYVNFGLWGGVVGVGVYGLLLGLGFVWLYGQAQRSGLWWAWLPFIAVEAVKSEDTIGYAANWIVKSAMLMVVVIYLSPAMRKVLWRGRARAHWNPGARVPPPGADVPAAAAVQSAKPAP
jgi:hypothetical protein